MSVKIESKECESTANLLTESFDIELDQPIELYDNTLREGEQPPGVCFTPEEKLAIAKLMDEVGVPWANVGFPAVSREEFASVKEIAQAGLKMQTAALSRLKPEDIDITVETGVDLVSLFLGSSDSHLEHKFKLTESEAIPLIEKWVAYAKSSGKLVSFGCEDATRTPFSRLQRFFEAADAAGADYLVVPDTVGVLTPASSYGIIAKLVEIFEKPIAVHFHNDLGLALANTLAALQAGARVAHVTVNGVGERSGNTALEELAVLLAVKYRRNLGFELDKLHELSQLVHRASGTRAPEHKAITGKWCFTHEAGIHVAGVLASQETYQPYPPAMVGRQHEIVFGKHSGAHGLRYLARLHGISLSDDACRSVLEKIKSRSKQSSGPIDDALVLEWIRAEIALA